jgi:hypothetical protein
MPFFVDYNIQHVGFSYVIISFRNRNHPLAVFTATSPALSSILLGGEMEYTLA